MPSTLLLQKGPLLATAPRPRGPLRVLRRHHPRRCTPITAAAAQQQQQRTVAELHAPPCYHGRADNTLGIIGACVGLWTAAAAVSLGIGAVLRLAGDTRYLRRSNSAGAWSSDWASGLTDDITPLALPIELDYGENGPTAATAAGTAGSCGVAAPLQAAASGGGATAAAARAALAQGVGIVGVVPGAADGNTSGSNTSCGSSSSGSGSSGSGNSSSRGAPPGSVDPR